MSKTITVQLKGLKETISALSVMGPRATDSLGMLIKNFADTNIVTEAKKIVPVDTGNLKGSIQSVGPIVTGTTVTVRVVAGNSAYPYALAVHENPRAGKTGGLSPSGRPYRHWAQTGQWKYLETPALASAKGAAKWLANGARHILKQWKR